MTAPFLVVTESMMNTCFFGQWRGGSIHRTGNHIALQGCIQEPCSRLLFQITPFFLLRFFRNRPYVLHNRNKFPRIAAAICLSTPGIVWFILVCVRKWHKPISLYETEIIIFLNINQEVDSVHITWGGHFQPLSSACQVNGFSRSFTVAFWIIPLPHMVVDISPFSRWTLLFPRVRVAVE